jgi:hypothetical protein
MKLRKKRSGFLYTPAIVKLDDTSPGLTAAVENRFGPATEASAGSDDNKENQVCGSLQGSRKADAFLATGCKVDEGHPTKGKRDGGCVSEPWAKEDGKQQRR